jgi:serine/threonine-protein kinase
MSQPVDRSDADRNLLFGILAVQMNFISRDALITAMHAWVLDKQKPLGRILLEQESLTTEQLQALDALIVQHLKAHGDDPDSSLAAIGSAAIDCSALESFRDGDVQASLAKFVVSPAAKDQKDGLPPPRDEGRFKKGRFHKEGGLGEVYFAEDTELHREVALKEIKPKYADDLASRGRFVIEAEITGGLEHPGIVPVYGLGAYPNGRPYYAMRFIRGDSLKDAIERFHSAEKPGRAAGERSLALRQLLRRFVDVCNAIAYAHNRGVLHRDLKPANIMLGPYGETLVVDWGLAKAVGRHEENAASGEYTLVPSSGSGSSETLPGSAMGTPGYLDFTPAPDKTPRPFFPR